MLNFIVNKISGFPLVQIIKIVINKKNNQPGYQPTRATDFSLGLPRTKKSSISKIGSTGPSHPILAVQIVRPLRWSNGLHCRHWTVEVPGSMSVSY